MKQKQNETEHLLSTEANRNRLLEEAAERIYPDCNNVIRQMAKETFIEGAKWQQEQDDKYFDRYMKSEKVPQIERMAKLGINTTGQCFEQMVTSLIIQQEQDKNKYSEEEVIQLLDALWTELDIWYNKKDDEQFNLIRWFYDSGLFKERKI